MQLKLINNLTKNTVNIGEVEDEVTSSLFYVFNIAITDDVIDGEYTYELYDNDKKVAKGLLQIGDYTAESKEYKDDKKTYIVYGE